MAQSWPLAYYTARGSRPTGGSSRYSTLFYVAAIYTRMARVDFNDMSLRSLRVPSLMRRGGAPLRFAGTVITGQGKEIRWK